MQTHNLGYPRIGSHRELKKASEAYWSGKLSETELLQTARSIRAQNWQTQKAAGIDFVPVNDFSFYDHVLDMTLLLGAIPERHQRLWETKPLLELYLLTKTLH